MLRVKTKLLWYSFLTKQKALLTEATSIQFDGTFYTVPILFYQLWTIFVSVGRHTVQTVHCLMTANIQELYRGILESFVGLGASF